MNTQKVAITIPNDIIAVIDKISKKSGVSRSKYISEVLRDKIKEEQGKKLISAYNEIFSDESIQKEQLETAEWFKGSGDSEGEAW